MDNGYTPHIAVKVDSRTQVPAEYVKGGEITLNISPNAVHKLQMGNDLIDSRRFGGVARQISLPVANIYALYARDRPRMTFGIEGAKPSVQAKGASEAVPTTARPPRFPRRLPTRRNPPAAASRHAPHQIRIGVEPDFREADNADSAGLAQW